MAITFADDLSRHGSGATSRTNMLLSSAGWISLGATCTCETTQQRVSGYSTLTVPSGVAGARHSIGGTKTVFGTLCGLWCTTLPSSAFAIAYWYSADSTIQFSLFLYPDGSLAFVRGIATVIGSASAAGVFTASTFNAVEVAATMSSTVSATDGVLTLYVNGVQVINATGLDNVAHASVTECSSVDWAPSATALFGIRYIADPISWDNTGSYANAAIGTAKVCIPLGVVADNYGGGLSDFTVYDGNSPTGAGYTAIDDTTPDGASSYIQGDAVNDASEFDLDTPPAWLEGIIACIPVTRMTLDSPGTANLQVSLRSGSSYTTGTDRAVPYGSYTRYIDPIHRDPNGGGEITVSMFSASNAKIRVKRTA